MADKFISSPANPVFRELKDLLQAKGIKEHGLGLLSGRKLVPEMLRDHRQMVRSIVVPEGYGEPIGVDSTLPSVTLAKRLFDTLDIAGTHMPLLVVRVPITSQWQSSVALPSGCSVLIPFQNPENVGSVIRTAAALGAAQVVLLAEAAHPFLPKSIRAAGTALYKVPLVQGPALAQLHAGPSPLYALHMQGQDIARQKFPSSFGLLAGLEGPGLEEHLSRFNAIAIPMSNDSESLNGPTAMAIALYAYRANK